MSSRQASWVRGRARVRGRVMSSRQAFWVRARVRGRARAR